MSTFVLVHGAWHGSWCWHKVIPLLEKRNHKVVVPDLPGHGRDKTPIGAISLQNYTDCVCRILEVQTAPVILVGHSMAGSIITQVAEYLPGKISMLVYLSAFLLRNGESSSQVHQEDKASLIFPNLVVDKDQGATTLREENLKHIFYADCPDSDVAFARTRLVPEAIAPSTTPVNITQNNFDRLPRVYIECLHDKAISPSMQKQMYTTLRCSKVISMATSHSPFFSAPEELAAHLSSL